MELQRASATRTVVLGGGIREVRSTIQGVGCTVVQQVCSMVLLVLQAYSTMLVALQACRTIVFVLHGCNIILFVLQGCTMIPARSAGVQAILLVLQAFEYDLTRAAGAQYDTARSAELWHDSVVLFILRICYGSLKVSVGLDGALYAGRGSSPEDIPPALKVPPPRCLQRGSIFWE